LTLTNEEVAPGQLLLRPGMIVTVRVGAQLDHKVMLLPMAAIHQGASPDDLMVYEEVTENGRELVRARKVSLGGVYNNEVEVVPTGSDVHSGSRVVITTAERLTDGISVQMIQDNTDAAKTLTEAQ
jgi:multidrug efflux pump subunit AcrA (membrane-fusion protein)